MIGVQKCNYVDSHACRLVSFFVVSRELKGIFAILATPFDEKRRIDFQSLKSLIDLELRAGVNGITILGILGEVMRLSDSEKRDVTKAVVEYVNERVPVVSGTGSAGTDLAVMFSKEAEGFGVDAVMVSPPRLTKPNDAALFEYYSEVASHVELPIVIQDEPTTYGVHLSPELVARLSEIHGVEYIKLEDAPTPLKITKIRNLVGDNLGVFGGLGGLYFFEELSRGACGVMTGFAFPEILVRVYEEFLLGNRDSARQLFYQALPLIRYEAQPLVSLALRKEILRRRGAIRYSTVRDPATKLDSQSLKELDELMANVKVLARILSPSREVL
jgi:4-hydroxy-tetrahydrodipicolinate synthase